MTIFFGGRIPFGQGCVPLLGECSGVGLLESFGGVCGDVVDSVQDLVQGHHLSPEVSRGVSNGEASEGVELVLGGLGDEDVVHVGAVFLAQSPSGRFSGLVGHFRFGGSPGTVQPLVVVGGLVATQQGVTGYTG
jgi:hypothetical protein